MSTESSVSRQLKHLSTLNEIGKLLNSTLNESVIRERAMGAITRLMDAEAGSLLMVDKERDELYFDVVLGDKSATVKTLKLKMGEGVAGWVAKNGKAIIIDDVSKDDRFSSKADDHSEFKTRNMVCVPVATKGSTIGVLQAINKKSGAFDETDKDFFVMFSNQVAIAIDNARLYQELKDTFYSTSTALADAIEKRDRYTGGHTRRVLYYSMAIGKELGLKEEEVEDVGLSAVLHDVGKLGVDDAVLRKEYALNDEERRIMNMHPIIGEEIMGKVRQLKRVMPGVLHHHERPDGKGYPHGLKAGEIHVQARVIAVADAYDAMTTDRPYRKGLTKEAALAELKRCAGAQFDKEAVDAFERAINNGVIDEIFNRTD